MDAVITTRELRKRFRARGGTVEAVRGVSIEVGRGEVFGFLGPNGAGKTTTARMLTTLLSIDSGEATVAGFDVARQPKEVRRRIGYVFGGDRGLYDRLSAFDNLRYFAELYALEPRRLRSRIAEVLESVGLAGRERERVEGFSRGMRQRLHLARGLLHDPPVLFFDEPTIGVDPVGAREVRQLISGLRDRGKTVLLTTHYMFEADSLCQRIAVISQGTIVASGSPRDLKAAVADRTVIEIEAYGIGEPALERMRQLAGVESVTVATKEQAQVVSVQAHDPGQLTGRLMELLQGIRVERIGTREPTLEDAYVALVTTG